MGTEARANEKARTMIRRVTFAPGQAVYFRLTYEAFLSRGSSPTDKRVSKDDKRSEAKILRALKTVSDPVGEDPGEGKLDARLRVLKAGGGVLDLEHPDFKRLQQYVEDAQWMSGLTDIAADLEDWLDTAEKVEPEK